MVMGLLALTQPLVHFALRFLPPEGAVHSGLSVPDSALFIQSMDMFFNGFHSPYAMCKSEWTEHSLRYYSVPHLWVYGLLGMVSHLLRWDSFLWLGVANGISLGFYLYMVWRFLCAVAPAIAQPAFALFALSSGPAGILWLGAWAMGAQDSATFEAWFFRFALYDLIEGPHFHPLLIAPRCYYTFPLGVFYGALAVMPRAFEDKWRRLLPWVPWVALAVFVYARAGVFSLAIAALMAATAGDSGGALRNLLDRKRLMALLAYAAPLGAGLVASTLLMRLNPATIQNHLEITSMAMWISPALCSVGLLLPAAVAATPGAWRTLPDGLRRITGFFAGYLAAYVLLYLARSIYYGTLWSGQDGAVAPAVSDLALPGGLVGVALAWRRPRSFDASTAVPGWVLPWAVVFFAVAVSGWQGKWFLQFGPQRLQVFLWLPICMLAATGAMRLAQPLRRIAWTVWLSAGVSSMLVTVLVFQAGMGRTHAKGAFAIIHAEWIQAQDREALELAQGGRVLAKPLLSDAAVRLTGGRAPFAVGAFNLSDVPYSQLHREAENFFSGAATAEEQLALLRRWCIEYVLVSDLRPIAPEARVALRQCSSLKLIFERDGTELYRVEPGH